MITSVEHDKISEPEKLSNELRRYNILIMIIGVLLL